jgi:hypothetical protein
VGFKIGRAHKKERPEAARRFQERRGKATMTKQPRQDSHSKATPK